MAGIKKTEVWGACPYRYVGNINEGGRRFKAYLCKKMWNICSPTYCLGPDEEDKENEQRTIQT